MPTSLPRPTATAATTRRVALVAAAAALLALLTACGGGGGGSDDIYPLLVTTDVAITDLDGDGLADVLALGQLSRGRDDRAGRLVVYRQLPSGAFADPVRYTVGTYPWRFAIADVDDDAAADVVVADVDGRAAWLMLQAPGTTGRLGTPLRLVGGVNAYDVAIADLNADGAADIAVVDSSSVTERLVLRYQDPAAPGSFRPPVDFSMPNGPSALAAGDVDGNGLDDLLSWVYTGSLPAAGELAVIWQDAGGPGAVTSVAPQNDLNIGRLAILDYDGDGQQDLFTFLTPSSADFRPQLTVVRQGRVSRTFEAPADTSLAAYRQAADAVFADLNGDGRPDAAILESLSGTDSRVTLLTQSGDGRFAPFAQLELPADGSRIAAGDVDGDGLNDLAVLGSDNGRERCWLLFQSRSAPGTFRPRILL